jgi:hypothetical protein
MVDKGVARKPGALEQIQGQDRGSAEEEAYGVPWRSGAREHHGGQGKHVDFETGVAGTRPQDTGEARPTIGELENDSDLK